MQKYIYHAFVCQVAVSLLDSRKHSEAVGHLELATGKDLMGAVSLVKQVFDCCAPQT